ncbi:MAG TPA: RNA polymerase sigma factor [Chitinophagaceae bacterium]
MQPDWSHILDACKRQDSKAQEKLYKYFFPAMMKVCLRYCGGHKDLASAAYNQAMLKVFLNIEKYRADGSIEAWIRRIVVNTCIDEQLNNTRFQEINEHVRINELVPVIPEAYNRVSGHEITNLIYQLPKNTATVFNLFVMEGYKHEEIGKLLGISSGTSKWHLSEARRLLKEKIELLFKTEHLTTVI